MSISPPPSRLVELPRTECLRLLACTRFGRLGITTSDEVPVIRPVNYVFDERSQSVAFRTAPGTKLHALVAAKRAVFEIDGVDRGSRSGERSHWLRIRVRVVSGRRIELATDDR